jgi:hypothetical protein
MGWGRHLAERCRSSPHLTSPRRHIWRRNTSAAGRGTAVLARPTLDETSPWPCVWTTQPCFWTTQPCVWTTQPCVWTTRPCVWSAQGLPWMTQTSLSTVDGCQMPSPALLPEPQRVNLRSYVPTIPISPELQRSSPITCSACSMRCYPLGNPIRGSGLRQRGLIHDRGFRSSTHGYSWASPPG